ncbi:MAG: epimerase [Methylobacterium sp. SCN 67-24]|nr:MAG: epimerase [Methylobacterium sp. SCN 67-24]
MPETVLVTGGNGFVGSWCIVELLRRGYAVRTTLRSLDKEPGLRTAIAEQVGDINGLSCVRADLMRDDGWDAAMAGVDYVLHVASPLGGGEAADRESLVAPAREGTLRVLGAAVKAGVRRVVMTSAAATARARLDSGLASDETVWADPDDPQFDAYRVSKIRAERAAWEFMRQHGGGTEFATVLPGAVFGPIVMPENSGSVQIIKGLMEGRPPLLPRLGFWIVDVRDLVDAHIAAMTVPAAAGERFIAAGEFMWMGDMARSLGETLGRRGIRPPRRRLPDILVRLLSPFMPTLRTLAPLVGRRIETSSAKARSVLGFSPRPAAETLADCGRDLLDRGLVRPQRGAA